VNQAPSSASSPFAWLRRGWRNVREAGGVQLLATFVVLCAALFIARFSWVLPDGAEPGPCAGHFPPDPT
jgi:adenylate cyclase